MGNAGNRQKSGTKLGFLAILACFALLLVFGCTSNLPAQMKNNTTNTNLTDANYSQGVEPVKIKNLPQGQMEKLVAAHNDFGFRMMKLLTKNESGKNVFISPTSLSLALSMAYRGAGGETERGMASALGFEGIGSGEIDSGSQYLIGQLGGRKDIELEAANSIWLNKDFTLKQDYQKAVEEYYFAKAQSLDFSDPASADTINMWIKDRTRGKIENVISPPIDVYRSFLVNAVYFKGKWAKPFDKTISREREFTSSDGTKKMVMMMKGFDRYDYIENDELQAVRLGYGNGSASMYIVLPRDGASGAQGAENFAESLDGKRWGEITSGMRKKEGTVIMPRFKVEYEKKLNEQLKQMGMEDAFDDTADFSRMAKEPLKISFVLHKTFVESNEEGTEAAAVTVIGMVATSAGPINKPAPFYMEINRPFFYAIQDDKTGEILFMGVMNEIEAQ